MPRPVLIRAASASAPATKPGWPASRRDDSLLTLTGGSSSVGARLAFGTDADGQPLLASASDDGTVWLWDPTTGTPVGDPLRGHTGAVAVAFGVGTDGRPLLASASYDRTVRLWDPTTGDLVLELLRRTPAAAIAAQESQLAMADDEGLTVIEVMDRAG